jgi:hypothetical protein
VSQEPCVVPESIRSTATALLHLVRSFSLSEYGIALGGAHAKGIADEESDVDLYLFATAVRPNEERAQLAAAFSPEVGNVVCWGDDTLFSQAGTDFRFRERHIECWLRNAAHINETIAACQAGVVRRDLVTWTTTGFYNHCCLSDVKAMVPLADPAGILARWKSQVATYPPKLRRSIIGQHLAAAQFWPRNFHYRSAVARADVIYVTGIVQQVVHNLVQVLFALNETYFPGDKRLDEALAHLPCQPAGLRERVASLLWPGAPATVALLHHQQEEVQALLREVEALVAAGA